MAQRESVVLKIKKNGGCLCGKAKLKVHREIVKSGVCHCRYCQIRSGNAFGIVVWFNIKEKKGFSRPISTYNESKYIKWVDPHEPINKGKLDSSQGWRIDKKKYEYY